MNSPHFLLIYRPQQASPVGSISSAGTVQQQHPRIPPPHGFAGAGQQQQQAPNHPILPPHQFASQPPVPGPKHMTMHPAHLGAQQQQHQPSQSHHMNNVNQFMPQNNQQIAGGQIHPHAHRPPMPDQNQNMQQNPQQPHASNGNNINAKPNSRASSSSGGNASTTHSTGGQSAQLAAGKQEQRLTHEQVRREFIIRLKTISISLISVSCCITNGGVSWRSARESG